MDTNTSSMLKRIPPAQKRRLLLLMALMLIVLAAIVWILNIEGIVRGPWSNILGVIFTVLGIILALLQWHAQVSAPALPLVADGSAISPHSHLVLDEISLEVNGQKGALIVYASKKLRGTTINLYRGFDPLHLHAADFAANVVQRKVNGHDVFLGVFRELEPANYTIQSVPAGQKASATVYAGHIAEIDWR